MKHHYNQKQKNTVQARGFTLVETLVAITILLLATVAPMTIAARGLQGAFYARDQITAFSLAQEGVELVRATRDDSALQDEDWLDGIPGQCKNSADGCGLDARIGSTLFKCTSTNCQLKYDNGTLAGNRGFYNYSSGVLTPFTRQIWVKEVPGGGDREAMVKVTVTWQSSVSQTQQTVTVESRIFNQYNNL